MIKYAPIRGIRAECLVCLVGREEGKRSFASLFNSFQTVDCPTKYFPVIISVSTKNKGIKK